MPIFFDIFSSHTGSTTLGMYTNPEKKSPSRQGKRRNGADGPGSNKTEITVPLGLRENEEFRFRKALENIEEDDKLEDFDEALVLSEEDEEATDFMNFDDSDNTINSRGRKRVDPLSGPNEHAQDYYDYDDEWSVEMLQALKKGSSERAMSKQNEKNELDEDLIVWSDDSEPILKISSKPKVKNTPQRHPHFYDEFMH